MSIETVSESIADKITDSDFIRIYGHHDADGIASAAIMCHALKRLGKNFQLTIKDRILPKDVKSDEVSLLCDFGSSLEDLPDETIVIDHHIPCFNGEYHVNPRLFGIDGETELSASGAAYIVANRLGDNRDLSGLALLGVIGDRQKNSGKNLEIISEGIANQFIVPGRGMTLPGRNIEEKLNIATDPYLCGISGDMKSAKDLVKLSAADDKFSYEKLISAIVLKIASKTNHVSMLSLWGDTYELERGAIHDAHSMAAVIESCGLCGRGGLGVSLCLRMTEFVEEGWDVAVKHRLNVISSIKNAHMIDEKVPVFEVSDPAAASCVADSLAFDRLFEKPVFVIVGSGEKYSVSARCPNGVECNLSEFMKNITEKAGGTGGGHKYRAGGYFDKNGISTFINGVKETFA
ncbi:single-stranded DNA-specific DHH superfamily exonuclease [Methanomicrobium sp. W14]|uniref:DHH family phosphoesterase n=1 Tax=Methanomicrobium sp. W14 TaxID=2817839 RepID=UPI001AE69C60|nr:DHH family phosphoesterase [Methanomicrobium sp. W14]MBP2132963.1 single-stranded DNA-specific DHH superfamily exonuclease [Methanomicrobium sp. W14]